VGHTECTINVAVNNRKYTNKRSKTKVYQQQKHNRQLHIRMCLQTELSTELYEAKNLVFNLFKRTLGNSSLNIF